MYQVSEWVSLGHPDKTADYISCYLLDRYLERDPMTRFAVEVQIKDNFVTLGGEISSTAGYDDQQIENFVREAVTEVGYTAAYHRRWGFVNTISGADIVVECHLSQQSPDIARGVDASGWGDQGIFHGMAVNDPSTGYMPKDWWLARKIGKHLYDIRYAGIDIKTQVALKDGEIENVVVAIPLAENHSKFDVEAAARFCCGGEKHFPVIVNGTGRFVQHGSVADCGTTGRKLAVDFYGGNCKIGGGSPWTKDGTKADLSLNLLARKKALGFVCKNSALPEVFCSIACRIGSPTILVVITDRAGNELAAYTEDVTPESVIAEFRLREPRFAEMCRDGLFAC